MMKSTESRITTRLGVAPNKDEMLLGVLRTHLFNYIIGAHAKAKGLGGTILFRADNTNPKRDSEENLLALYQFLTKEVGLEFDYHPYNAEQELGVPLRQSGRTEFYKVYADKLLDLSFAFMDKNTVFFDVEKYAESFGEEILISDMVLGEITLRISTLLENDRAHFPIYRSDGSPLYHLCSPCDDSDLKVTHVFRGQDKLPILIYHEMVRKALGFPAIKYGHLPMLLNESKKLFSGRYHQLIRDGYTGKALVSYALSSVYGDPSEVYESLDDVISTFDVSKLHRYNAAFDADRLESIEKVLITNMSCDQYTSTVTEKLIKELNASKLDGELAIDLKNILVPHLHERKYSIEKAVNTCIDIILNKKSVELENTSALPLIQQVYTELEGERPFLALVDNLVQRGVPKKEIHQTIRWLLSGSLQGLDTSLLWELFVSSTAWRTALKIRLTSISLDRKDKQ